MICRTTSRRITCVRSLRLATASYTTAPLEQITGDIGATCPTSLSADAGGLAVAKITVRPSSCACAKIRAVYAEIVWSERSNVPSRSVTMARILPGAFSGRASSMPGAFMLGVDIHAYQPSRQQQPMLALAARYAKESVERVVDKWLCGPFSTGTAVENTSSALPPCRLSVDSPSRSLWMMSYSNYIPDISPSDRPSIE